MLLNLKVKNFALIRSLEFSPEQGLNVITGETGAGKSILLGALGLVLGNRAETGALLNREEKCVVEAEFRLSGLGMETLFAQLELDHEDISILRREINPQGKSRAFVNDTPVSLAVMKEIGERLIQIHTQNTGLLVTDKSEQLAIIDTYAGHQELLHRYENAWRTHREARLELEELKQRQAETEREQDFIRFQFDELEAFGPVAGEEETLPAQIEMLGKAGEIQEACIGATTALTEGDGNASDLISGVKTALKNIFRILPHGEDYRQRLDNIGAEIRELSRDLQKDASQAETNPEKLEELNQRLARLQLLLRKHQAISSEDLLKLMQGFGSRLQEADSMEDRIRQAEARVQKLFADMVKTGRELHQSRINAADGLTAETSVLLHDLGMPRAAMKTEWQLYEDRPGPRGIADVSMLFSANAGAPLQPLEKSASGGELSRVNFCFKSLMAGKKLMPTLIYDEADTGVSGEVAAAMGRMMRKLGAAHQVIAITHLPQVAAAGHAHYFVYKAEHEDSTESRMKKLTESDRVQQLAQMLSGGSPGEAARANAMELLTSAAN